MPCYQISILCAFLMACVLNASADPVHVLVWDERQPRQAEAYDNFLGNEIASRIKADDIEVRSVALDDPEQGLTEGNLKWANVLVWWGHARHKDVTDDSVKRVMDRLLAGDLDLIALHSAHWARPFVESMNWRSRDDARAHFAKTLPGKIVTFTTIDPPKPNTVPGHGSVLTPAYFAWKKNASTYEAAIHLPWCCFPDYRNDGAPSKLTVKSPDHPIAAGLPATIGIPRSEMYNGPFHVPAPDEVIFEETWESGERFRSGMVWSVGKGQVFYFRPGHEQYPVFKQPEMIQILANACRWLGGK